MKDEKRKKIAIFIDYTIRVPFFNTIFSSFKQYMFENLQDEIDQEGDFLLRDFWKEEIKKKEVENFYMPLNPNEDDYENKNFRKYFYNEEHFLKFIEDYSFALFAEGTVPNSKDIDMINIAQKHLFDVVLIDEYLSTRKKLNTFFYLSKIRVTPQSIVFLKEDEPLDETEFLAVWNPKKNKEQVNGSNLGEFENWLKELEGVIKN